MKKAFTLIELLVVTGVIAILASTVFRLAGSVENKKDIQDTIMKLQKLENCLSGYYAAFGNYPPVPIHGSRNPFYSVSPFGGIQLVADQTPDDSVLEFRNVKAALMSQPVRADFPLSDPDVGKELSNSIQEMLKKDEQMARSFRGWPAENPFDGLPSPNVLNDKRGQTTWPHLQLFRFGLMSYLLPRYLLMMGRGGEALYDYGNGEGMGFNQWDGNNARPCRFRDGMQYDTWEDIANLLTPANRADHKWEVELIQSQTVTQRWMPNLEGLCSCGQVFARDRNGNQTPNAKMFFGIKINDNKDDDDIRDFAGIDLKHPDMISELIYTAGDSQQSGSSGKSPYVTDYVTLKDSWGEEFYYYSEPPYQSYRLWSGGPNMMSFPPWYTPEELEKYLDKTMTYTKPCYQIKPVTVKEALADDIVFMSVK